MVDKSKVSLEKEILSSDCMSNVNPLEMGKKREQASQATATQATRAALQAHPLSQTLDLLVMQAT